MTIDDAIKQLNKAKNEGIKNIIFAWWDSSQFDRPDDDTWASICDTMDDRMDWSNAHDQMSDRIRNLGFEEVVNE